MHNPIRNWRCAQNRDPTRRRAHDTIRQAEEEVLGVFFFLLFFLFLLDDEEEAASRSLRSSIILFVCWSERPARSVFDSKRSSCIDCSRNCSFSSSSSFFLSSSSFLRCRRVWRNESRVVHLTTAKVWKRRQTCGARACRTLHTQLRRPKILRDSWPPSTPRAVRLLCP